MAHHQFADVLSIGLMLGCLDVSAPQAARHTAAIHGHVVDQPDLQRLPNGHYRIKSPWTVEIDGQRWQVQQGYTSNGITAPKCLKPALGDGAEEPETWAAMFHDWLFTQPGIPRHKADLMFHDLLIAYGVSPAKAGMMHAAVSAYSLPRTMR